MTDTIQAPTPEAISAIESVIMNDEGGWIVTSNNNDPDGGWTVAGVTEKTWNSFYPGSPETVSSLNSKLATDALKQSIYSIYYNNYYLIAEQTAQDLDGPDTPSPLDFELSCIINIGPGGYKIVLQATLDQFDKETSDEVSGEQHYKNYFLHQWRLYYTNLVVENTKAWIAMALNQHMPKPAIQRYVDLNGWISRVDRYV